MTLQEITQTYTELHPNNNPKCNGEHCTNSNSIVRIIPLDDSVSVHLCESCFDVEIGNSIDAELDGKMPYLPTIIPFDVYPIGE